MPNGVSDNQDLVEYPQ